MGHEHEIRARRVRVRRAVLSSVFAVAAGPAVLWMIVSFLRAHIEPPKAPVYRPLALATSKPAPLMMETEQESSSRYTVASATSSQRPPPAQPPAPIAVPVAPVAVPAAPSPASTAGEPPGSIFDRVGPMFNVEAATTPGSAAEPRPADTTPAAPKLAEPVPLPRPRAVAATATVPHERVPLPRRRPQAVEQTEPEAQQPVVSYGWGPDMPQ